MATWLALAPSSAWADEDAPSKTACVQAYGNGQRLRRTGDFMGARVAFRICAQPVCPGFVSSDCSQWMTEADASIPSLIVDVRRSDGEVVDAKVWIDNVEQPKTDAAFAKELNPGEHRVMIEAANGKRQAATILLKEAEKRRRLVMSIPRDLPPMDAPPPSPAPPRTRPWYVFAVTGLAASALLGAAAVGGSALYMRSNLADCSPQCGDDRIDPVRDRFIVADVALLVGLLSGAASAYLWLTPPSSERASAGAPPMR